MPSFRGTGAEAFPCSGYLSNYDKISALNCQNTTTTYGQNYYGFSVDSIAMDNLLLIQTLKNGTQPIYVMGRSFGSYVLHRMLQIDSSLIDAIIMDGVCAGPYCNASDWDIQRDLMGTSLLDTFDTMNTTSMWQYFTAANEDPINAYQDVLTVSAKETPICGRTNPQVWVNDFKEISTFSLFDQTIRPKLFSSLLFLNRCLNTDFGSGMAWFFDIPGVDRNKAFKYYFQNIAVPSESTFIATHIILSELYDHNTIIDDQTLQFTQRMSTYVDDLINQGWETYPSSPLRSSIAKFTKPMLLLNGNYDPKAPISAVKSFASNFNATLIIMPGMSSNTMIKSYTIDGSVSCGLQIVSSFITCPSCTVNQTCLSTMIGLTPDGDISTKLLFGDAYASFYIQPGTASIIRAVFCAVTLPIPMIICMGLIYFRKNRRVQSRLFGPYLGLFYVFEHLVFNTIKYGAEWISLDLFDIAVIIQEVLLVSCCLIFSIQAIRFFILSVIYRNMIKSVPNSRILKLITSRVLFVLAVVFLAILWTIFGITMIALQNQYGYERMQAPYIYASIGLAAMFGINSFSFWMFDMISHAIKKRCNVVDYFVYGDPLLFRVDNFLVIPIIATGVVGGATPNLIVEIVFDQISVLLMCLYFGGNICIACLIDRARGQKLTNQENPYLIDEELGELKDIFESEMAENMLRRYCMKEFSLENVIAWKDLQPIRANLDRLEHSEFVTEFANFYMKFLQQGAEMELNISARLHEKITSIIHGDSEYDPIKVLTELSDTITANLLDTFYRYKLTKEYAESRKLIEMNKQIEEHIQ
jgi:pimeloyl-ACP methyl ester carboxylesterase